MRLLAMRYRPGISSRSCPAPPAHLRPRLCYAQYNCPLVIVMKACSFSTLAAAFAAAVVATLSVAAETVRDAAHSTSDNSQHMQRAIAAALRNDVVSVETEVTALASAPASSPRWHTEIALHLLAVVHRAPRTGRCDILTPLVTSAIGHLNQAELTSISTREKASSKALLGIIYERFRGDMDAAIVSYRAAAALDPQHTPAIQAAQRLERTRENIRLRK